MLIYTRAAPQVYQSPPVWHGSEFVTDVLVCAILLTY